MPLSIGTSGSCFVNMAVKHGIKCHAVKVLTKSLFWALNDN